MYSVNQVNHLYVVKDIKASTADLATDSVGTLYGPFTFSDSIYFKYKSPGGLISTDRIKKCKVKWMTFTQAANMRRGLKKVIIALDSSVNSGNAVIGQDYIINFDFKNYFGMSDEDRYFKHAAARAYATTASDLYRDLAISLAKNMSREIDQPFSVALTTSGSDAPVDKYSTKESLNGSYTGIKLLEVEQPWELGRYKQLCPDYTVNLVPVTISGVERNDWATVTVTEDVADGYITNGAETADREWFFHGERGDQYRGKDWPMSIATPASLLVDPTKEYDYAIIHFWDDIDNEGPQKSERDMTFVTDTSLSEDLFAGVITPVASEVAEEVSIKANGASVSGTKVATPVISDFSSNKCTLTCATPGATMYYTTNGNMPTSGSTAYTEGTYVSVSASATIKVIAIKSGMDDSDVASKTNS